MYVTPELISTYLRITPEYAVSYFLEYTLEGQNLSTKNVNSESYKSYKRLVAYSSTPKVQKTLKKRELITSVMCPNQVFFSFFFLKC